MEIPRKPEVELHDHDCVVLNQAVDGHDVEEGVVRGQARPALLDEFHHRRDVGHLGGEGG